MSFLKKIEATPNTQLTKKCTDVRIKKFCNEFSFFFFPYLHPEVNQLLL